MKVPLLGNPTLVSDSGLLQAFLLVLWSLSCSVTLPLSVGDIGALFSAGLEVWRQDSPGRVETLEGLPLCSQSAATL